MFEMAVYFIAGYGALSALDDAARLIAARRGARALQVRLGAARRERALAEAFAADEDPFHDYPHPRDPLPRPYDRSDWK